MVDVSREPGDDVGGGVVRQQRVSGAVVGVEDVVDGLDGFAVTHAERLVRRLDAELVAAAGIPLLVEVQSLEPVARVGFDLAFLPALTETP